MVNERFGDIQRCRGPRELGKTGGGCPTANPLAVHTPLRVAEAKKGDQWSLFAFVMASK